MAESVGAALLRKQYQWPQIARDIALLTHPGVTTYSAEDIAQIYKLSSAEFIELTKLPAFISLVKLELQRIEALGPFGGQRIRAAALAEDLQESLYARAKEGDMADKDALQFLSLLLKTAGVEEQQKQAAPVAAAQAAVNISFNIPKLPTNKKLAHLAGLPQTNVIEI